MQKIKNYAFTNLDIKKPFSWKSIDCFKKYYCKALHQRTCMDY